MWALMSYVPPIIYSLFYLEPIKNYYYSCVVWGIEKCLPLRPVNYLSLLNSATSVNPLAEVGPVISENPSLD